jgi:hypothetical protein
VKEENTMKLNQECVRSLLIYLEENLEDKANGYPNGIKLKDVDGESGVSEFSTEDIYYCAKKLLEAKYIKIMEINAAPKQWRIEEITWEGHDYLNLIRDKKVWEEINERTKPFASVGLDIIKSLSIEILKGMLQIECYK